MNCFRLSVAIGSVLCLSLAGEAQESASLLLPVAPVSSVSSTDSCSSGDLLTAPTLSLRQRACFYKAKLLSPRMPLKAALSSAMGEWRRSDVHQPGMDDFGRRFGIYYARRTGQSTGELLAGYLNHEDPRYHPSLENGTWKRSRAALLSVLVVPNEDGRFRPALIPLAGAFGSGMVGMPAYRMHNSLEDGFRRTGGVYFSYFALALAREFRPELSGLANRFIHRHN